jgi:hypothetical protein
MGRVLLGSHNQAGEEGQVMKRARKPVGTMHDIGLPGTPEAAAEAAALLAILDAYDPAGRIERLRRHPSMVALADDLVKRFERTGRWREPNRVLFRKLERAEEDAAQLDLRLHVRLHVAPILKEHAKLGGPGKKRGAKHPDADKWMDDQIKRWPRKWPDVARRNLPRYLRENIATADVLSSFEERRHPDRSFDDRVRAALARSEKEGES